jgi:Tfp pilus assembly ATPase PilU
MFHHDDFFNYIVDYILQQQKVQHDCFITINNNQSPSIKNIINDAGKIRAINQFYKDVQDNLNDIIKYEYQPHIHEY